MHTLRIGLTGGIAAGKTTAGQIFVDAGDLVIDADDLVRQIYAMPDTQKKFADKLPHLVDSQGLVGTAGVREAIELQPSLLHWFEAHIHPLVRSLMQRQLDSYTGTCCVGIIPLLYETGMECMFDRVIGISISPQIQAQRVLARKGMNTRMLEIILARQMDQSHRNQLADCVVAGDLSSDVLRQQLLAIRQSWLCARR